MLLLARTCLGLAAGLFTVSVPAMIAEGLPKKKAEARLGGGICSGILNGVEVKKLLAAS